MVESKIFDITLEKNYGQLRYDLDSIFLDHRDIQEVKELASEKRMDYGIAPIAMQIFTYLAGKEQNLFFESQAFDNPDLDAFIIWPDPYTDSAYVVLNSNQSLFNQIFATAHEYYHYIKDFEQLKRSPQICSLSQTGNKSDQKANRFAAEFLLPEVALKKEVEGFLLAFEKTNPKDVEMGEVAVLSYVLTIRYGMPLKAVLFRLFEEGYLKDINSYLENYGFLKKVLSESNFRYKKQFNELLSSNNPYIEEKIYDVMLRAFEQGFVSLQQLEEDAKCLGLDKGFVESNINMEDYLEEQEFDDDLKKGLIDKINSEV